MSVRLAVDATVFAYPYLLLQAGAGQERFFGADFQSEVVPGAGHFLHLERPGAVTPKIVDWLSAYDCGR